MPMITSTVSWFLRFERCLWSSCRTFSKKIPGIEPAVLSLANFPPDLVRNFSIIAHVDHGKSTLADRLLEVTGTVSGSVAHAQLLDRLPVERERGITVKAQSASLFHREFLLNLVDTPGHVDFNFEVQRSLAACQSVVLLIDANEGVQAQTVANFYLAFERDLVIIPVLNKIDLPGARPQVVKEQLKTLFDFEADDVLEISAKHGTGVPELLDEIVRRTPPPSPSSRDLPFRALLFDSWFEPFRGAICLVALQDGCLRAGDQLMSLASDKRYQVREVGIFSPESVRVDALFAGQVGYIVPGMKAAREAVIGDTLAAEEAPRTPLRNFKAVKPMVFAGVFPAEQSHYEELKAALDKLTLNDSSVEVDVDSSPALGAGWRLGFLGLLHMDVFRQRLEQEHKANPILTTPSVPYKVTIHGAKNIKSYGAEELTVYSPAQLPPEDVITEYQEPFVIATLIFPEDFLSTVMKLCLERRGEIQDQLYIDSSRLMLRCEFPLAEILVDFYDRLKSQTSGYASLDYEDCGYRPAPLVKLQVLLNGDAVPELSILVHSARAQDRARQLARRLKEEIPRQMILVRIQVCRGKRVLAKEDVKAYRKDVTQKLYGGDVTRRMKLLKQQAEGKKKMRQVGKVQVPRETFINVLKQT